jgi:hypothetical protein
VHSKLTSQRSYHSPEKQKILHFIKANQKLCLMRLVKASVCLSLKFVWFLKFRIIL